MTGRISVWQPWWFHGVFAAHSSASSRSRTSRTMKPPSCSLVSMNGPSVTWRLAPSIRTVVAACEPSSPSQAISTPAARAASSNACHAAISRAPSSGENSSAARSSPYSVSSTFTLHLRLFRSSRGRTSRPISTAATRQLYSRRASPRMYGMRGSNRSARKPKLVQRSMTRPRAPLSWNPHEGRRNATYRWLVNIVGRDVELAAVGELVESGRALVLTGEVGIGKTALWSAGVEAAGERGLRVLAAQPASAEIRLSFAALGDLLDGQPLAGVPAPQRRALEVALLREEPHGAPPEPRAIAAGFLSALRTLTPLMVAIDDVQWLDAPSADAVAFAARRLGGAPVRFLLTRRRATALDHALRAECLRVGPLGLGAVRSMLAERLGLVLPRPLLRRLFDTSGGNPLFALELGRSLAGRSQPEIGEELVLPDALEDLMGARVEAMPAPVRRLMLALALGGDVPVSEVPDAALHAGAVAISGDRVRLAHPLLGAAARRRSGPAERRAMHRRLACTCVDGTQRARHLVLAATAPDAAL